MKDSMPVSTIATYSVWKWIWIVLVLPIVQLFLRSGKQDVKIKALEVKGANTEELIKDNTKATRELTKVVTELRVTMAAKQRHDD